MWKKKYSDGDYKQKKHARTFEDEFYYINFVDKAGRFESAFSELIEDRNYAYNRARWISRNSWYLHSIPYKVEKIGVYSSLYGHIKSYVVE